MLSKSSIDSGCFENPFLMKIEDIWNLKFLIVVGEGMKGHSTSPPCGNLVDGLPYVAIAR